MNVSLVSITILTLITVCWGFAFERSVPIYSINSSIFETRETKKSVDPKEEKTDEPFQEKRELIILNKDNKKIHGEVQDVFPIEGDFTFFPKNDEVPKNVILLFIDESGQDREALWKNIKSSHNFPVQGMLQICPNDGKLLRFPFDDSLVSGPIRQCGCKNFLISNYGSILSWAHRTKKMSTGTVSGTNFSLPSPIEYKLPILRPNFEGPEEILRPQFHDDWHLIDLDKEEISLDSSTSTSTQKHERSEFLDVFDTFSKIRVAFFRNLIKKLNKNDDNKETLISVKDNLLELIKDTVEKLKSASSDKGFIMIATAPGYDLSPALDLLKTEVSEEDTLMIVSGICSKEKKEVPFFASGPGAKNLQEANSIWDLPLLIRKVVSGKIESLNTIWKSRDDFRKRFARDKFNGSSEEKKLTTVNKVSVNNFTEVTVNNSTEKITVDNLANGTIVDITTVNTSVKTTMNPTVKLTDTKMTVGNTVSQIVEATIIPLKVVEETKLKQENATEISKIDANPRILKNEEISKNLSNVEETLEMKNQNSSTFFDDENLEKSALKSKASGFMKKTTIAIFCIATFFLDF